MTTKDLRADWALGLADGQYLGILTDMPHCAWFEGGQKFAWSCLHVHLRKREAEACAQAELDRRLRDEQIFQQALHPERRLGRAALADCHWHPPTEYPGHQALELESAHGNGITAVCLEPADLPALRAAVIPGDPDLAELKVKAAGLVLSMADDVDPDLGDWKERSENLVLQAHARGYRLAAGDMQAVVTGYEEHPVTAAEVREFLRGLGETVLPAATGKAIAQVLMLLDEREPV